MKNTDIFVRKDKEKKAHLFLAVALAGGEQGLPFLI